MRIYKFIWAIGLTLWLSLFVGAAVAQRQPQATAKSQSKTKPKATSPEPTKALEVKLKNVTNIFVKGNNAAATEIRKAILGGTSCLTLASKAEAADATLEVQDQEVGEPGQPGTFGSRQSTVSGTLTLESGDLIWSESETFNDNPIINSTKFTALALFADLAHAACEDTEKGTHKDTSKDTKKDTNKN